MNTPTVTDSSQANLLPTGYVTVRTTEDATDLELATAAGFCSRHWGYTVTRYEDGAAVVALWND